MNLIDEKKLVVLLNTIDSHITNTCNAGYVLVNADPEMLKKWTREALAILGVENNS